MFLAILSRTRSRIILGESGDGSEWMYVDAYFRSRSCMYECTCVDTVFGHVYFDTYLELVKCR
jgi:hypothetical protein